MEAHEIAALNLTATSRRESEMPRSLHFVCAPADHDRARDLVGGRVPESHPLQSALAKVRLAAARGEIEEALKSGARLLKDNAGRCLSNPPLFLDMLITQFILRRLDLVGNMLAARYRPACQVTVAVERNGLGSAVVTCDFELPRRLRIIFDSAMFDDEHCFQLLERLTWVFPQLAAYTHCWRGQNGKVLVSQWDCGLRPGLAYSDSRDGYFLIPDPGFIATEGYAASRQLIREFDPRWSDRKPVAFWRGSSTGLLFDPAAGWRSLPRLMLCELARTRPDLFDVGISEVVQLSPDAAAEIEAAGLMRPYAPFREFLNYRYQIDIDGNTNSWSGLYHKLLTGSPVLKVASPTQCRQWYYDRLQPWDNFVPVLTDMSDLVEKLAWLAAHDDAAQRIGQRGRALANALELQAELKAGARVIEDALRHFNGG